MCEPYPGNMGVVPPAPGFLAFLREATAAAGALLVFDEVISGFRVAPRRARRSARASLPDLTILGKIIGGGLPAAAYAGPRALMEQVAPAGEVYQAGTLSGNPLATAAGIATLRLLDEDAYRRLDETTRALAAGIESVGRRAARAGSVDDRPADALLQRAARARLRGRARLRHGRLRRLLPGDARSRRLPAAVAVRGLVPVARSHVGARRAHLEAVGESLGEALG